MASFRLSICHTPSLSGPGDAGLVLYGMIISAVFGLLIIGLVVRVAFYGLDGV